MTGELPPLPYADDTFDLVYAMSVFTHLTDSWSAWLLELHRVLCPGGFLIVTFLGAGLSEAILGEPYDESRTGANQVLLGRPWSDGGPCVFHSPWWLRAHWGRAMEIVELSPSSASIEAASHGVICMRKDGRPAPTVSELERPEPDEPRELAALRHNVEQLKREVEQLRRRLGRYESIIGRRAARRLRAIGWRLSARLRGRG